jgi:RND family efflux transporter MFP subunit
MKPFKVFQLVLKIVLPILVIALAVKVTMTIIEAKKAPTRRPGVVAKPLVETETVFARDIPVTVEAYGTVRPAVKAQITPQVSGKVVELAAQLVDGGFLKAGELVLRLDARDFELAVESSKAEVAKAQYELARAEEEGKIARNEWEIMNRPKEGNGSAREKPSDDSLIFHGPQLKLAHAALAAAGARMAEAELALSRTRLTAPFDALVLDETVDLGQHLTPGKSVATLQDVKYAEVVFPINDEDMAWLGSFALSGNGSGKGPKVTVKARYAGREERWQGRAVRTEAQIDAKSRTINLVVEVKDPFKKGRAPLLSGLFVEGEISGTTLKNAFEIKRHALRNGIVWLYRDGILRMIPAKAARLTANYAYIVEGLIDGDRVITSRLDGATEGMPVEALTHDNEPPVDTASPEAGR